jgi:hypothetical protein
MNQASEIIENTIANFKVSIFKICNPIFQGLEPYSTQTSPQLYLKSMKYFHHHNLLSGNYLQFQQIITLLSSIDANSIACNWKQNLEQLCYASHYNTLELQEVGRCWMSKSSFSKWLNNIMLQIILTTF